MEDEPETPAPESPPVVVVIPEPPAPDAPPPGSVVADSLPATVALQNALIGTLEGRIAVLESIVYWRMGFRP